MGEGVLQSSHKERMFARPYFFPLDYPQALRRKLVAGGMAAQSSELLRRGAPRDGKPGTRETTRDIDNLRDFGVSSRYCVRPPILGLAA